MVEKPDLPDPVVSMLYEAPLWRERYLGGSPDRERELFAGFARDILRLQNAVERRAKSGRLLRGFHAKQVMGVAGTLRVRHDLPAELHVEHCLQPKLELPVLIRYSTSSHDVKPDAKRNGHGIALRIQHAAGVLDLLFSDSPASHARDAQQFMTFVKVLSAPLPYKPVCLLRELGLKESARLVRGLLKQTFWIKQSLAARRFWGKTPMRINAQAVKYQLVPRGSASSAGARGVNFLRDDLIQCLAEGPIRYELRIQRFVDEERTPLEDHSVEWSEQDAPAELLGELVIEQGAFQRQPADLEARIERLAFNPWHTTDALRPLGSLNRARKFVYAASADHRLRPAARGPGAHWEDRLAGPLAALAAAGFELLNRRKPWWELPAWLGAANLYMIRRRMREHNLHDVEDMLETIQPPQADPAPHRQSDGRGNDPQFSEMGGTGRRFGRNVPRRATSPESGANLITPSPRQVSRELLARDGEFVPARGLNLLAAAWIQFQVHDWFAHAKSDKVRPKIEIPLSSEDTWAGPRPMRVPSTPRADTTELEREYRLAPAYDNQASHWWDGSQIYGADSARTAQLRAGARLRLDEQGLLPLGTDGLPLTGTNDNWWLGLELMHTLFAREHNALCDMLQGAYPGWPADRVFETARLVNAALMAKIHTIEWTPTILAHPALKLSMDLHWWGLLGQRVYRAFGRFGEGELISGIPGSRREHFEVPFALTEEFVSVYRLHGLLPDAVPLSPRAGGRSAELPFPALAFANARRAIADYGLQHLMIALGRAHPGALRLNNYPRFLINLEAPGEPLRDVGAIDILRDRERGVPRYSRFRELLGLPRVSSYEELTGGDLRAAEKLRRVYGADGLSRVDLLVGCLAEQPPPGFGFGDTAFRVFVLMASRRLKSDRFFTDDYNEATYTREGLAWVRDNTMTSVLLRHFPALQPALRGLKSAFAPWNAPG